MPPFSGCLPQRFRRRAAPAAATASAAAVPCSALIPLEAFSSYCFPSRAFSQSSWSILNLRFVRGKSSQFKTIFPLSKSITSISTSNVQYHPRIRLKQSSRLHQPMHHGNALVFNLSHPSSVHFLQVYRNIPPYKCHYLSHKWSNSFGPPAPAACCSRRKAVQAQAHLLEFSSSSCFRISSYQNLMRQF